MGYVQKNCEACGALISVRLADHKRGWGRFCDKACAAAHKCGQRPRDVNEHHAKSSVWARDALRRRAEAGLTEWPRARPIRDQAGRVKVRPIYHSPANCLRCGAAMNGPGFCEDCQAEDDALAANEAGWDGHKGAA